MRYFNSSRWKDQKQLICFRNRSRLAIQVQSTISTILSRTTMMDSGLYVLSMWLLVYLSITQAQFNVFDLYSLHPKTRIWRIRFHRPEAKESLAPSKRLRPSWFVTLWSSSIVRCVIFRHFKSQCNRGFSRKCAIWPDSYQVISVEQYGFEDAEDNKVPPQVSLAHFRACITHSASHG